MAKGAREEQLQVLAVNLESFRAEIVQGLKQATFATKHAIVELLVDWHRKLRFATSCHRARSPRRTVRCGYAIECLNKDLKRRGAVVGWIDGLAQ